MPRPPLRHPSVPAASFASHRARATTTAPPQVTAARGVAAADAAAAAAAGASGGGGGGGVACAPGDGWSHQEWHAGRSPVYDLLSLLLRCRTAKAAAAGAGTKAPSSKGSARAGSRPGLPLVLKKAAFPPAAAARLARRLWAGDGRERQRAMEVRARETTPLPARPVATQRPARQLTCAYLPPRAHSFFFLSLSLSRRPPTLSMPPSPHYDLGSVVFSVRRSWRHSSSLPRLRLPV